MRIDSSGIIGQIQGMKLRGLRRTDGVSDGSPDTVSLSSSADDFRVAMEALTKAPDVRADRVADLQQRIQSGGYQTPIADLTEKLLDRRA